LKKLIAIYSRYQEIINYLIVGILTTLVSLGTYYLCVYTFLDPNSAIQLQLANIISWLAACTFAYFTNRSFVFKSKNENVAGEASKFFLSRIGTLLMDMFIMFIGCTLLGFSDKIVKILVQVVVTIGNYVLSKLLVFNK